MLLLSSKKGYWMAIEIYTRAKKSKLKTFIFKVDFEKAFDTINWEYLDSVMNQMAFGRRWCAWINGRLSSVRASVLINGAPIEEFLITRGVRQGDPLSPFLIILPMEGLHMAIKGTCNKSLIQGVKLLREGPLYHTYFMRMMPYSRVAGT